MTRVSRAGSLSFNRVKGSYVNRQRSSDAVERTVAIEPVIYAQNQTAFSSENHLIAYDNYYRRLDKLEKDFEDFLGKKEFVREQAKKEKKDKRDRRQSKLYRKIKSLIVKYNRTIEALLYIDKNYQTNNTRELYIIISNYEDNLEDLGITTKGLFFEIDGKKFWDNFLNSSDPYEELFRPLNRLIMSLYIKFRNIMMTKKSPYHKFNEDYKGTIINVSS